MCIYSDKAINYDKPMYIVDCLTGETYSQQDAERLPKRIQKRLLNKPTLPLGAYVYDEKCLELIRKSYQED